MRHGMVVDVLYIHKIIEKARNQYMEKRSSGKMCVVQQRHRENRNGCREPGPGNVQIFLAVRTDIWNLLSRALTTCRHGKICFI